MEDRTTIKLQILSPSQVQIIDRKAPLLYPALSFEFEYYVPFLNGKKRKVARKTVVDKQNRFPTGLLPKVIEYAEKFDIDLEIAKNEKAFPEIKPIKGNYPKLYKDGTPFKLRGFQEEIIETALREKRGQIISATGSGKTVSMMAIASHYPNTQITIIVHTLTLLSQTEKELKWFFPKEDIGVIGQNRRDFDRRITVAMIQSIDAALRPGKGQKYLDMLKWINKLEIVFVDEGHHVSTLDGSYVKFLFICSAPIRFSVTATAPYIEEAKIAAEGYIGPIIHEVNMDNLIAEGIIAKPKLRFLKAPENPEIKKLRKYPEVYEAAVVESRSRNKIIVFEAFRLIEEEELTSLIIVSRIEHGKKLEAMAAVFFPSFKIEFVQGATDSETRTVIKDKLQEGELDCAIATAVFKEGIDIPSLGAVINAAGGKSEIATLQAIGRGLRTFKEKKDVVIIDIIDTNHHYLTSHLAERLVVYSDKGWL